MMRRNFANDNKSNRPKISKPDIFQHKPHKHTHKHKNINRSSFQQQREKPISMFP